MPVEARHITPDQADRLVARLHGWPVGKKISGWALVTITDCGNPQCHGMHCEVISSTYGVMATTWMLASGIGRLAITEEEGPANDLDHG